MYLPKRYQGIVGCLLMGLFWGSFPTIANACFSIIAGKEATVGEHVIFAHNEDDLPPQVVNHYKVPRKYYQIGDIVVLRNGGTLPQVECTWAYIWSEMPGMLFSDSYINEWGVGITSNNCPSREDQPDISDGGIGYMLRRLVAERAKTAREGVLLAGQLVERFGYIASGRTYSICDPHEGWLFCVVQGKHWLAQRVPDDEVAVIANSYSVRQVDLSDEKNTLACTSIVQYAEQRGWYDASRDGRFDFAATYACPETAAKTFNTARQWKGLDYLWSDPIPYGDDLPAFLHPRQKVCVTDVIKILRDIRGTKTDTEMSESPEFSCRICRGATQTSFVAQLRNAMPRDIGIVYWMCLAPPETSVYIPYYWGLAEFPMGYVTDKKQPSEDFYNSRIQERFHPNPLGAFWTFSNYREKVMGLNPGVYQASLKQFQTQESRALSLQVTLDPFLCQQYQHNPSFVKAVITNFVNGQYIEALNSMTKIMATTNASPRTSKQQAEECVHDFVSRP